MVIVGQGTQLSTANLVRYLSSAFASPSLNAHTETPESFK